MQERRHIPFELERSMAEIFGADRDAIATLIEQLAAAFLAGDRVTVDELLQPETTVFDSTNTSIVAGIAKLDALRRRRDAQADEDRDVSIRTEELRIWEIPGTRRSRLATYLQTIRIERHTDGRQRLELTRNTAVVHVPESGSPRFTHIHEDVIA